MRLSLTISVKFFTILEDHAGGFKTEPHNYDRVDLVNVSEVQWRSVLRQIR
jgi:hypothetical protein